MSKWIKLERKEQKKKTLMNKNIRKCPPIILIVIIRNIFPCKIVGENTNNAMGCYVTKKKIAVVLLDLWHSITTKFFCRLFCFYMMVML